MNNYYIKKSKELLEVFESNHTLGAIFKMKLFHDEPKIHHYVAYLKNVKKLAYDNSPDKAINATGLSFFSKEFALFKCLCELAERMCQYGYSEKMDFIKGNNNDLTANYQMIYPVDKFEFSRIHNWVEGADLLRNIKCFIPAQLIYLNYARNKNEKMITGNVISTGAAGGFNSESAILRGICEIIERDAFMCVYLNKINIPRIDNRSIPYREVHVILEKYNRYLLEPLIYDITNDTGIPSYLTILYDKFNPPYISLGLKSGFDGKSVIIGSLEEAFLSRPWQRKKIMENNFKIDKVPAQTIDTLFKRASFWHRRGMLKKIGFLLNQKKKRSYINYKIIGKNKEFEEIKSILNSQKLSLLSVDITLEIFKKINYKVYKMFIPELQPLYLNEKYREINIKRLSRVRAFFSSKKSIINDIPHPFL